MGRCILKSLDDRAGWEEAKEELRKYLGEENPREAAWKSCEGIRARVNVLGK